MQIKLKSWTVSKTTVIQVEGVPVAVDTLTPEIKLEIETFDRIRQDYTNKLYELEVLHCALAGKRSEIEQAVKILQAEKAAASPVATQTGEPK
jgi:hypothetical protein